VELWVDKVRRTTLRPGRNLLLTSMTPGDHLIHAYNPVNQDTWSAVLHYEGNEQLKWMVTPGHGIVRLKDLWQEPVVITIDGNRTLHVNKDQTLPVPLSFGTHVIEVSGTSTDITDRLVVHVETGQWTSLPLKLPLGSLVVKNVGKRALKILVDDREIGVLDPGGAVNVDALKPGHHKVMAIDASSKAKWLRTVQIGRSKTTSVDVGE